MKRLRLVFALLTLAGVFVMVGAGPAAAQTVVQGYNSSGRLQTGMIVQLDTKDATAVLPATQDKPKAIHGVVIPAGSAPIAVSDQTKSQVYVAAGNTYRVLVSDQNGAIKTGDYVTISALDGIGMKADGGQSIVVGQAASAFSGQGDSIGRTTVKVSGGRSRSVQLGYVAVALAVGHNPLERPASGGKNAPGALQRIGATISGKQVSMFRIYLGLVLLTLTMVIVGVLLYSAVRASIISLGRNPLARRLILRNMLQVAMVAGLVLIIGLFAVYLLLKL